MRRILFVLAALIPASVLVAPTASATDPLAVNTSTLTWSACAQIPDFQCATLDVPLDRAQPSGAQAHIAVTRHLATGTTDQRIGSLFFNPGGPGGSGLESAIGVWDSLPDEIKARFDLVTWDPRGIGESTPTLTGCRSPYPKRPATGPVDWAEVVRTMQHSLRSANGNCYTTNKAFIDHLGTNEVVRDLDQLRAAVGDEQLTFWGMSYGTRIGYVYALRYPTRVRAVVLDGPIDPAGSISGFGEAGVAPDQAYTIFAQARPTAATQMTEVITSLTTQPLVLPDGTKRTRWDVLDTVMGYVASQGAYNYLASYISAVHTAIFGSGADQDAALAKLAAKPRRPANTNAGGMFAVVNCLDYADRPTRDQQVDQVDQAVRYGPMYGGTLATSYVTNCSSLPVKADPIPLMTSTPSQVPVLISGSTMDGSTISIWLARMNRAFPQGRTVTYSGGQHVVWNFAESTCVNDVVNAYVLTTVLPAMDVGCSNAVTPTSSSARHRSHA